MIDNNYYEEEWPSACLVEFRGVCLPLWNGKLVELLTGLQSFKSQWEFLIDWIWDL